MTHYVLLKFVEGADMEHAEGLVRETYAALDRELSYLHEPVVHRCCVERDTNADIMVSLTLDGPEFLQPYLKHPLHVNMAQTLKDEIKGQTTFDHQ